MTPKRIVFLGSKPVGYACFEHLIREREVLNIQIAGLLTQPRKEFGAGSDLVELALQNNISIIPNLKDLPECDILYSVQYHEILKEEHISKAIDIAVNLHMAPLPEYRGCNQFSFAILDGKQEFGTTIHAIDPRIDHGDIIFQRRFPIPDDCWVSDLYSITEEASIKLFRQTLKALVNGNYNRLPQELLVGKYGSSLHYRKEMAAIKQIDLSWDKEKINRHLRATSMPGFEPPYFWLNGKKMYITEKIS